MNTKSILVRRDNKETLLYSLYNSGYESKEVEQYFGFFFTATDRTMQLRGPHFELIIEIKHGKSRDDNQTKDALMDLVDKILYARKVA